MEKEKETGWNRRNSLDGNATHSASLRLRQRTTVGRRNRWNRREKRQEIKEKLNEE